MSGQAIARDVVAPPAIHRPARSRKRAVVAGLALAVALGAGWYGYDWWTEGRFLASTDDAYVGGNVTAISPHIAGFVSQILVTDNERVRAGQLLIRLDDRDARAALDRAIAVVGQREAALGNLAARSELQRAIIRQAVDDLAAQTARAAFTSQDASRYRSLAQTSAGSVQSAERALAADQQAQAAMLSSQAGIDAAKQQLVVLGTEIAEARAAVAQADADRRAAELDVGYTEIRSPIDGIIGNRAAQVGAYVSGGTYLLSIVPVHGLWVDANFKEDDLARMTPGQPATIVADVLGGHVFHGHLLSLAPATGAIFSVIPAENATGNFTKIVQRVPVRIELDADDTMLRLLRPGLSTTASVDTRETGAAK